VVDLVIAPGRSGTGRFTFVGMVNKAKGAIMKDDNAGQSPLREIAHRARGGMEIALLWNDVAHELTLGVFDARSGTRFEVAPGSDEALEMFNDPDAHAPALGLQN
jgi:hypothetical protein